MDVLSYSASVLMEAGNEKNQGISNLGLNNMPKVRHIPSGATMKVVLLSFVFDNIALLFNLLSEGRISSMYVVALILLLV